MATIQDINLNRVEVKLKDTDDPIAQKVSWEPANPGGASFKTQYTRLEGSKFIVERALGMLLFCLVFMIPGIFAVILAAPYFLFVKGDVMPGLFMIVWGGLFAGVGWFLLNSAKKMTFDKSQGVYFTGDNYQTSANLPRKVQGALNDIYAIQLGSERVHSSSSSSGGSSTYTSYELNIVFNDGDRINVIDHGKSKAVDQSAKDLGGLLNVPIWKAHF